MMGKDWIKENPFYINNRSKIVDWLIDNKQETIRYIKSKLKKYSKSRINENPENLFNYIVEEVYRSQETNRKFHQCIEETHKANFIRNVIKNHIKSYINKVDKHNSKNLNWVESGNLDDEESEIYKQNYHIEKKLYEKKTAEFYKLEPVEKAIMEVDRSYANYLFNSLGDYEEYFEDVRYYFPEFSFKEFIHKGFLVRHRDDEEKRKALGYSDGEYNHLLKMLKFVLNDNPEIKENLYEDIQELRKYVDNGLVPDEGENFKKESVDLC